MLFLGLGLFPQTEFDGQHLLLALYRFHWCDLLSVLVWAVRFLLAYCFPPCGFGHENGASPEETHLRVGPDFVKMKSMLLWGMPETVGITGFLKGDCKILRTRAMIAESRSISDDRGDCFDVCQPIRPLASMSRHDLKASFFIGVDDDRG